MKTKILYKIDNWNRVAVWKIQVKETSSVEQTPLKDSVDRVLVQEPLFHVEISWSTMEESNRGLTLPTNWQNVSLPFDNLEEAEKEFHSRVSKQMSRRGYTDEIPTSKPLLPMLAQTFDPAATYTFPSFYVQPKLDGFRCIGSRVQLLSRRDTRISACPNIEKSLQCLPPGIKLDGELYIHGVEFQILSGYIKRDSPCQFHHLIEYHVYDMIDTELTYDQRLSQLELLVTAIQTAWEALNLGLPCPVKLIHTHEFTAPISDPKALPYINELRDHYIKLKYEGVMVKNTMGLYEINKRSPNLLKVKAMDDDEFQIIDVEEGKGSSAGHAIFVCKTDDGSIFRCNPAFTKEAKRRVWIYRENYKGKWLKVKFQGWTNIPNRVPRQPIGLEVLKERDEQK